MEEGYQFSIPVGRIRYPQLSKAAPSISKQLFLDLCADANLGLGVVQQARGGLVPLRGGPR